MNRKTLLLAILNLTLSPLFINCGATESTEGCPQLEYVGSGPIPTNFTSNQQLLSIDVIYPAYEKGEKFVFIDARPPSDYKIDHIKDAISLPFYDAERCAPSLPSNAWYVTYCACPHNESQHAAEALEKAGFKNVWVLDEGYLEWKKRGYPITPPKREIHENSTLDS
ncbi:MAG: rhodanese-like domain-containing protein [Myxococcota bacterium]|nr:rhodanese-like domain-containing protein [Myxococcota bacterium]